LVPLECIADCIALTVRDVLLRIKAALDGAQIPFMVSGSFASAYHGAPRASQDIDLIIDPTADQLESLLLALPESDYYVSHDAARDALQRRSQFNVIDLATNWKIDLIVRKSRPFSQEEFARKIPANLSGVQLSIATPEDVAIAKLEWAKLGGSQRQMEDVAGILQGRRDLDREYIQHWVKILELDEQWRSARAMAGENA